MAIFNKQKQVDEILKCGKDPIYFLNRYAKIATVQQGLSPFKTYPFQDDVIKQFIEHRLNVVLKARQLGLSTITAGFAVWLALFHKQQNILVIATKKDVAINFIKKVKTIIRYLPKWLILAPVTSDAKASVEFGHGSTIKAIPTSDDAGRSEALSLLIIDEAAFIRNFDDLWTGLAPTISTGGRCIVLSTPNGVGGQYHKLYTDAEAGVNNFNSIYLPWDVHPDHDEEWFENETRGMAPRKVAQEYLCDFVASGDTFLSMDDIEWIRASLRDPIDKMGVDRSVWVWSHPKPEHQYIISADVARGDSADFSTFHVIDMMEGEIVAEYKGRMPPDEFGVLLDEWGKRYNTALLVPENNSFGYSTIVKLRDLGYRRVYKQGSKAVYIVDYSPIGEDIGKMGFNTNGGTRIRILTKMEEVLRQKALKVYSSRLYDELKTFVWTGTRAQAMKGRNDDLVMALAIGLWLYDVSDGYSNRDKTLSDNMLEAMGVSSHDISEVPGSGRGMTNQYHPFMPKFGNMGAVHVPEGHARVGRDPRFNHGDFGWVLGMPVKGKDS